MTLNQTKLKPTSNNIEEETSEKKKYEVPSLLVLVLVLHLLLLFLFFLFFFTPFRIFKTQEQ